ncbi:MAG: hypothetical protein ACJAXI_003150 [Crocinitomicaceae bacterium]|jgi:uncharacterized protein YfaS (alpha-2-macroglobulin family)
MNAMKRLKISILFSLITLLIVIISGCGQTRQEIVKVDPAFRKYVSAYTSGMVSREDAIQIELADEIEDYENYPDWKLQQLITVEPHVEGKVVLVHERLVEFVPSRPMGVNQFYTVSLKLNEFVDVDAGFEVFKFQFATHAQSINVDFDGLRSYNRHELKYQKLEGSISTTDFEKTDHVKKALSIYLDGKKIPFKIEERYDNEWDFVADSIPRGTKDKKLVVKWDGILINSFSNGRKEFVVPSLHDFSVNSVKVKEQDDQIVVLNFSDPLEPHQSLYGIISIPGITDLKYKINFNTVDVYIPGRKTGEYTILVTNGIKNSAGYKMNESYDAQIHLSDAKPEVRLIGSGSILPNSQGLIFPFEAIALKAVDVRIIKIYEKNVHHFLQVNNLDGDDELTRFGKVVVEKKLSLQTDSKKNLKQWNSHVINLEDLIKTEPGAIYQVAIKFNKAYTLCECNSESKAPELTAINKGWNEGDWHRYGFNGYSTWGYNDSDESPCNDNYYYGRAVRRNILASNIGMIFKLEHDKTAHAILTDMVSTLPMSGATVSYYDYTNKLIASGTTNSQGMLEIKLKNKPFLMIAKSGKQRGYLKLTDGHVNSLSKFDIGGDPVEKGIKGFIYTERGVWRPGDSIYINFILQDKNHSLPLKHPVNFELVDPNGNTIYEVSKSEHWNGVYDFRTGTSAEAPTGSYSARVTVGDNTYKKSIKVETIKPNRLKIYIDPEKANTIDSCEIAAKWLHGASAKGLKANVQVRLTSMKTTFKAYKHYVFDSPIRNGESGRETAFDGLLDADGKAKFLNSYDEIEASAGKLKAHYTTKVYEKGGGFSIDHSVAPFSPYDTYVGISIPKVSIYDNTLETGTSHKIELVTVNSKGNLKKNNKLKVKIYKVGWNWWYDGYEDLASFTSRSSTIFIKEVKLDNKNGKTSFDFKVQNDDYGKYLVLVTDEKGRHQTGKLIHLDWPYWSRANRSDSEHATMLSFATNKKKYVEGEDIRISFPSPSDGRALVSVESGEKVVQKFWVETTKGETSFEFKATAEMAPNVFLHVTMIQPHNATKNDSPIRMYGVMPIEVDDPFTHLHPVITMKDKIRPESKANIKVTESNGRKMTYTLAIVDEGLLDLTHFSTPRPWNTFYAKEALGVQTWDMYDNVIGSFSGKLDHLLSVGGDGSYDEQGGQKANRFKPMVKFLGPFVLPAGASKNHQVDIPNYVGSVRVMVVARDNESYGHVAKAVAVKKPLMVLATMPRVLGTGEEFTLPVNVFAMEKHVKNVTVRIEANDIFAVSEPKSKNIQFSQIGDEVINFKLKTKQRMGIGKVKVIATSGNEDSTHEIEIDIRPSNPTIYETEEIQLEAGKSISASVLFDGIEGSQSATIEATTLPALSLGKRLGYLIDYPHGCVEQTTSAVFPQLYLSTLVSLNASEKKDVERNIKAGITRLQLFQTYEGGFSYWPGESYESEWGTNYAGNFILEAELAGYRLPSNMKSKWVNYQKDKAINWTMDNGLKKRKQASTQLIQAYRLYLLALCDNSEVGAMNRLREEKNLSTTAKWRLASAYAVIGQKEAAEEIVKGISTSVSEYRELSFGYGSGLRDRAIVLETQGVLKKKEVFQTVKEIAGILSSKRWLSTQETAYSLLSIAKYYKANGGGSSSKMSYSIDGAALKSLTVGRQISKLSISAISGSKTKNVKITNNGTATLFITVTKRKIPKLGKEKTKASKMTMSVSYKDMDGKVISVDKLKQGTEFVAEVTIGNTDTYLFYEDMALNQIFPSGWEIHNSRLFGTKGYSNPSRYQDFRDDRVLTYYSLLPGKSQTFTMLLNATYKGKFYLPAIYSEAMYDHGINAQIAGKWILVE